MDSRHNDSEGRGLLFSITSLFRDKSSGRYLSFLLRELGRRNPEVFAQVISENDRSGRLSQAVLRRISRGEAQFETEWRYSSARLVGSARIADLSVLLDCAPILII